MKLLKYTFIISLIGLLSGCANVASTVSNSSSKYEANGTPSSNHNQQCHDWCHNGWCSTHCDPVSH